LRSRLRETQASETIRIGDEFGKLPNFPQDRKEKCGELKLTTQTQDRMLAAFFGQTEQWTPLFRLVDCREHYLLLSIGTHIITF